MHDMLLKNGTVVAAEWMGRADLLVKDGKFSGILQPGEACEAREVVDADGMLVFPGAIDCHAHFQVPGYTHRENFETGSRAAAAGGVTTVIDMPLNNDPPTIHREAFELKKHLVEGQSYVDYAFWGGYVDDNLDRLEELADCGVAAFKSFLSPVKEGDFTNISLYQALRGMERLRGLDVLLGLHCEDHTLLQEGKALALREGRTGVRNFLDVHSVLAEKIAVSNVIDLCRETGARVHICHVSHPDVAERIRLARAEGLPLSAETCPHYLGFTEDDIFRKGSVAKCTPPLRIREASDRLWDYVLDGTLSCIGSDHSPAAPEEKDDATKTIWETWGGLNAVQFMLPFMFELVTQRGADYRLIARTMSKNPAELFGLPNKGDIRVGRDADVVLIDPNGRWQATKETMHTLHPVSIFEGMEGRGAPMLTVLRGQITARDGRYLDRAKGTGRFLAPARG